MNKDVIGIYKQRINSFNEDLQKVNKKVRIVPVIRLMIVVVGIATAYFTYDYSIVTAVIILVSFFALFLIIVKFHSRLKDKKAHLEYLIQINNSEVDCITGKYDVFEDGHEYIDYEHPYSFDLDLFGKGSLFQYLNRTCSIIGKNNLADWLGNPSKNRNEIISRQEAIKELTDKLDWRQNLQCIGYEAEETADDKISLLEWVNEPSYYSKRLFYRTSIIVFPIITMLTLILSIFSIIPVNLFLLFFLINLSIVGFQIRRINVIHAKVSKKFKMLKKYAAILRMINSEKFKTSRLKMLNDKLHTMNSSASQNINKLANIINSLDQRLNMFATIFINGLFLWDIQYSIRLEKWQLTFKEELPKWFSVIGEFETLSSLACFAYNNRNYTFPEINSNNFVLEAKEIGHPLIHTDSRVDNDISINSLGKFSVITGANMAGKSTFLRTIGVNMILAMIGTTVCAKKFDIYPIKIYTSMRTLDSLTKSESYFYAELKRLRNVILQLSKDNQIFILLDEILKGTNSHDKHKGSVALMKQLIKLNAVGIIATHDIQLGELENIFPDNLQNYCFEVEIDGGKLDFDYKLREGISKNLNATNLMKEMGITI